jgi:RNA polymerase sigma-70 factor, ECF subfamily
VGRGSDARAPPPEERLKTSPSRAPWLDEAEETTLIRMAQQGNRQPFMTLVDYYQRPLYRLAFALTRRRDDATAITRESFERAWAGIRGIPEGKRFFPWLLRMARNLSVAQSRRRAGEPMDAPDAAGRDSSDERDDAMSEHRVLDALRSLRPDEQMALALRVVKGLSYSEIAAWLDHPVGITLSRLSTARGFLLSKESGDSEGGAVP